MALNKNNFKICVVGLGYVGLPLAARFSLKGFDVIGYDINQVRVSELCNNFDKNDDIKLANLEFLNESSKITSNINELNDRNIFIVTVPTPINDDKTPDLASVISSTKLVGSLLKSGSIVIYESTVYPGVTDDICTPILEEESKLTLNEDFSTGYSPERINPGDKINTIEKIKKVVSASNLKALESVSFLYSSIINAGIHEAPSIKVAEAAKVTENIQRDVNIALINELHQLYSSLDINTNDVIEAASTKWNFMKLTPGMVGGHCISIDPYYLMYKSKIVGYTPKLMQAARKINDEMCNWVYNDFLEFSKRENIDLNSIDITFLGYSFKENCSDIRNTKVKELIFLFKDSGIKVSLWDPLVEEDELVLLENKGVGIFREEPQSIELAFLCVSQDEIVDYLNSFKGPVYDYKNIFNN